MSRTPRCARRPWCRRLQRGGELDAGDQRRREPRPRRSTTRRRRRRLGLRLRRAGDATNGEKLGTLCRMNSRLRTKCEVRGEAAVLDLALQRGRVGGLDDGAAEGVHVGDVLAEDGAFSVRAQANSAGVRLGPPRARRDGAAASASSPRRRPPSARCGTAEVGAGPHRCRRGRRSGSSRRSVDRLTHQPGWSNVPCLEVAAGRSTRNISWMSQPTPPVAVVGLLDVERLAFHVALPLLGDLRRLEPGVEVDGPMSNCS